jgi:hypothetical protein
VAPPIYRDFGGFGVQNVMKRQADIMGVDAKAVRKIWKQKENHKTRLENLEPTHKALPVIKDKFKPGLDPSPRTRYVSGLRDHEFQWNEETVAMLRQIQALEQQEREEKKAAAAADAAEALARAQKEAALAQEQRRKADRERKEQEARDRALARKKEKEQKERKAQKEAEKEAKLQRYKEKQKKNKMKNQNKRGARDMEEQTGGAAGPDPANEPKGKKQKLSSHYGVGVR